jgi:putative addiction module CopG family antidote
MNINLTPEQERIVKDELKSGHFRSAEEVIGEALQVLREKERSSETARSNGAQHEAVRDMLTFVEKNHVRLEGVSVKELIHEGHRL